MSLVVDNVIPFPEFKDCHRCGGHGTVLVSSGEVGCLMGDACVCSSSLDFDTCQSYVNPYVRGTCPVCQGKGKIKING